MGAIQWTRARVPHAKRVCFILVLFAFCHGGLDFVWDVNKQTKKKIVHKDIGAAVACVHQIVRSRACIELG